MSATERSTPPPSESAPSNPAPVRAPVARSSRAFAPDVARGMMLLFIALANVSWHLWDRDTGLTNAHPVDGTVLDKVLQTVMMVAVDGRSYPLFAFLFGYGMVQFHRSRVRRGIAEPVVRRMLWRRHWALLLFGLVHAALLFMGDVLGAYGLAGLLLVWLFFRRKDRTLVVWAGVLAGLLAVGAVFQLVGGAIVVAIPEATEAASAGTPFGAGTASELTAGTASYGWSVVARTAMWLVMTPGQVLSLAIPIALLCGIVAARRGMLDDPAAHRRTLTRLAAIGIPLAWAGGLPGALLHVGALPALEPVSWAFLGLGAVTGIAGGLGYAAAFGLLAARWQAAPPAPTRWIAAVGKRSLSFYLFQSLVFAPLLSAWGLGLGGRIGTTGALAIALGVWAVSVALAMVLERRGMRGPCEVALRRLTYGRLDPRGNGAAPTPTGS